jgi:hypothetical protein
LNRYLEVLSQYKEDIKNNKQSTHPKFFDNYINQFGEMKSKNISKVGILYTNSFVAKNIIENGHIWLNDIKNMNDSSEMKFSVSYFEKKIAAFHENADRNHEYINIIEETFREHKNKFYIEHSKENEKLVLAMCFSQAEDDATMWDRYANKGNGVAIHFNLEKLYSNLTNAGIFFPNTSSFEYGIAQVCYPVEGKCQCFDKLYDEALEAYIIAENQDELNTIRTLLHTHVLELLMSHKHPSFKSENEIRMYSQAPSKKTWGGSDHIHEHNNGKNKSCHIILNLHLESMMAGEENLWRELVKKVVIGPNADEATRKSVYGTLKSRDLEDIVIESDCPLRV